MLLPTHPNAPRKSAPRCHTDVTTEAHNPGLGRTGPDDSPSSADQRKPRQSRPDAAVRLPKLNMRVRFPSSAPCGDVSRHRNGSEPPFRVRAFSLGVRLAAGTHVEILNWLDDHARCALSVTAHRRVTGPIVASTFRKTCATQGIPASTLTDIQSGWAVLSCSCRPAGKYWRQPAPLVIVA